MDRTTTITSQPQLPHLEPYVDEIVVGEFLHLPPRRILEMARKREIPAHPIGNVRKTWRFRLSEIEAHFTARTALKPGATMGPAVLRTRER